MKLCTMCGYVGAAKSTTPGHILIELVLWLCFLVPGLIYTIWRHAARHDACPACGSRDMIPAHSPMGQRFIREHFPDSAPPVSGPAYDAGRAAARVFRVLKGGR